MSQEGNGVTRRQHRPGGQRTVNVAGVEQGLAALRIAQRGFHVLLEFGGRCELAPVIFDVDEIERLARLPPGVGGHGMPAIALGNADDAIRLPGGGRAEGARRPGSDGGAACSRIDHAGQPHVRAEFRAPVDLGRNIEAGQRLSDQARRLPQPRGFRQVVGIDEWEQFGKGHAPPLADDIAVFRVEPVGIDIELAAGGGDEKLAGRGPGDT